MSINAFGKVVELILWLRAVSKKLYSPLQGFQDLFSLENSAEGLEILL